MGIRYRGLSDHPVDLYGDVPLLGFICHPTHEWMAAIDKVYTQQISTIMVFITGVLGGVAGRSGVKAIATATAKAESNDNDEPPKP
jgi:hypothetical protein